MPYFFVYLALTYKYRVSGAADHLTLPQISCNAGCEIICPYLVHATIKRTIAQNHTREMVDSFNHPVPELMIDTVSAESEVETPGRTATTRKP